MQAQEIEVKPHENKFEINKIPCVIPITTDFKIEVFGSFQEKFQGD